MKALVLGNQKELTMDEKIVLTVEASANSRSKERRSVQEPPHLYGCCSPDTERWLLEEASGRGGLQEEGDAETRGKSTEEHLLHRSLERITIGSSC